MRVLRFAAIVYTHGSFLQRQAVMQIISTGEEWLAAVGRPEPSLKFLRVDTGPGKPPLRMPRAVPYHAANTVVVLDAQDTVCDMTDVPQDLQGPSAPAPNTTAVLYSNWLILGSERVMELQNEVQFAFHCVAFIRCEVCCSPAPACL